MDYLEQLETTIHKNNSLLCVGLDTDLSKVPDHLKSKENPVLAFNTELIDATADLVCAFKPNSAFYEARGAEGLIDLKKTCEYIRSRYPEIPIILDAKRADIGSTNEGYVQYAYDYLGVSSITLQPYLGKEALAPFLARKDKGCIILCKTSNPGSGEFQNITVNNRELYRVVAEAVAKDWNTLGNCSLVVGATYPEELKIVREIIGEMFMLVPGIGSQGGDIERSVTSGLSAKKSGMIINSSRGIMYASHSEDFAQKARTEAESLRAEINKYRT